MLKKSLLVLAILATAGLAHADDSSFPKIDVKGINPGPMSKDQSITFYGKNAGDFFNMLPHSQSVEPAWDKIDAKVNRELMIVSNGHNLLITCSKGKVDYDTKKVTLNPQGTECKVTLDVDNEGDSFDFKPVDVLAPKSPAKK